MVTSKRFKEIMDEFNLRSDDIGLYAAVEELAAALERAEQRCNVQSEAAAQAEPEHP